ncbi:hypothetical protein NL676_008628 [Syzygium grande]|nr:hypothetical protein NL676_008628 [Syzygium grande]
MPARRYAANPPIRRPRPLHTSSTPANSITAATKQLPTVGRNMPPQPPSTGPLSRRQKSSSSLSPIAKCFTTTRLLSPNHGHIAGRRPTPSPPPQPPSAPSDAAAAARRRRRDAPPPRHLRRRPTLGQQRCRRAPPSFAWPWPTTWLASHHLGPHRCQEVEATTAPERNREAEENQNTLAATRAARDCDSEQP